MDPRQELGRGRGLHGVNRGSDVRVELRSFHDQAAALQLDDGLMVWVRRLANGGHVGFVKEQFIEVGQEVVREDVGHEADRPALDGEEFVVFLAADDGLKTPQLSPRKAVLQGLEGPVHMRPLRG